MNAASARTAQSIVENLAEHTATNGRVYVDKVDLLSDLKQS